MSSIKILNEINKKKEEARNKLHNGDNEAAKVISEEIKKLEEDLKRSLEMDDLIKNGQRISVDGKNVLENRNSNKNMILPDESFAVKNIDEEDNFRNLSLSKLVKGISGRGWDGAEEERNYLGAMLSMNNQAVIPRDISNEIIDKARANSAVLKNITAFPMWHNNVTIAVVKEDAEAHFVVEGEKIPSSKPVLDKVTMEGKTLALFVPVSEQLLDSAENMEQTLQAITAKAISTALDKAILYGLGKVESLQQLEEDDISRGIKQLTKDEILGISNYETINKIEREGGNNYDNILAGIKECRSNNSIPTHIAYSTNTATDLATIKDTTGRYIEPPKALEKYIVNESNNVKDNEIYIYDSSSMLIGVHKNITIEWGTTEDMFGRLMKGLRVYLRADLAVINPKGITKVTITG